MATSSSDTCKSQRPRVTHEFDFCSADTNGKREPLCIRELVSV